MEGATHAASETNARIGQMSLPLIDRFYSSSPIWAQQATVAAYGWWWYRRRFGTIFHRLVAELASHEHWTREQFETYQAQKLQQLFDVARGSRYYSDTFAQSGVTSVADPFDALRRMPLLTKETLRSRAEDLLTARPPRGTLVFKSSGTTGTPTRIYYPPDVHALEIAGPEARSLRWAGLELPASSSDVRCAEGVPL